MTLNDLITLAKSLPVEILDEPIILGFDTDKTSFYSVADRVIIPSQNHYIGTDGIIEQSDFDTLTKREKKGYELLIEKHQFLIQSKSYIQSKSVDTEELIKQTAGFSVPHLKMEQE